RHRNAEAERALADLFAIAPDHARGLAQHALLLAQDGRLPEALASARKATLSMPKWPFARNLYARLLLMSGRKEDALREARRSLSLDPNLPETRKLMADLGATSGSTP